MEKGKMIIGISEATSEIFQSLTRIQETAKKTCVFTDKETRYIVSEFTAMLKLGNKHIGEVKKLLSPKLQLPEDQKAAHLQRMFEEMKGLRGQTERFETAFIELAEQRKKDAD